MRYAEIEREYEDIRVRVTLNLDGGARRELIHNFARDISTGIGFFDHMLTQFAFWGEMDLGTICEGSLHIDDHQTVEEVGGAIGQAIAQAISGEPTKRYGSVHTPMDDALVLAVVEVSGRGELFWDVPFTRERIGNLSTEGVREFFRALAHNSGLTIHLRKIAGVNDHHLCEAAFKAFGFAVQEATRLAEPGVHSHKSRE
ncbi:MAG: imidazoleglycerol-phosphate dehydratase [Fimbriimonas ginsengisoli]|uniref:Imidazoleglycerol-phosphate dehydratase n=1 Tax=Fimbriimonas ginsengisoli TaxID=1005039 RepID=A0A931LS70_FIMGI|nr:imidazoleglycerol-phosphate dehydratase [Fimbriimonas ginsengisoli]